VTTVRTFPRLDRGVILPAASGTAHTHLHRGREVTAAVHVMSRKRWDAGPLAGSLAWSVAAWGPYVVAVRITD